MKLLACIYVCLGLVVTTKARFDLNMGMECDYDRECKSQHCVKFCDNDRKLCMEARWFFTRHGLDIPTCLGPHEYRKKVQYISVRRLGETCHTDSNCAASTRCIPECGEASTIHRCSESLDYYKHKRMDAPRCVERTDAINRLASMGVIQHAVSDKNNEESVVEKRTTGTEDKGNLRTVDKLQQEENLETKLDKVEKILGKSEKNVKKIEKATTSKETTLEEEDITAADIEANRLETEAMEKLKEIDMKVLELQSDVMNKADNSKAATEDGEEDAVDTEKKTKKVCKKFLFFFSHC